jgi:histidyl-tRNA synthetase
MFPEDVALSPADVMVAVWNEDSLNDAVQLARELRRGGLCVDLYPQIDKLGKQFKYAAEKRIRFVVLIGEEERAKGEVAVKNIETAEQRNLKRQNVTEELLRVTAQRRRRS